MATPREFQVEGIERHVELLRSRGASAEASVPGFGKTFVAGFVAREMNHPLVVVCPKVVIPHWQMAAAAIGAPVTCISNYEQHKLGHTGLGEWQRRPNKNGKGGGTWRWTVKKPSLIVFDEAHALKTPTSQNAKLGIAARRQGIPTLLMSATLAQDPLDLQVTGYMLGIHGGEKYDFMSWSARYGCRMGAFSWEYDPKADPGALGRLHQFLFPAYGHRKTYAEIPGFPPEVTQFLGVPISDTFSAELDHLWERIRELEQLKDDAVTALTERLRARQMAELGKVESMVELANESLANGQTPLLFVNFKDTLRALQKKFPKFPVIEGNQTSTYRSEVIRALDADEIRGMILQTQAGGVGISLHDTRGQYPRHSIISPPENSRDFVQVLGRNRRVGGMSPAFRTVLFAHGTIEDRVRRKVTAKANQIETINDGDLDPLR